MVYLLCLWIERDNARFLAAAVATWAAGMYAFMEMAPAIFVVPVLWLVYRPIVRFKPLMIAGALSVAIWYPYLRFENSRDFIDVRSLVLRERVRPANFQESWCNQDPAFVPASWRLVMQDPRSASAERERSFANPLKALGRKTIDQAGLVVSSLLLTNFNANVGIPGFDLVLFALVAAGIASMCIKKRHISDDSEGQHRAWSNRLRWLGMRAIFVGTLFNEKTLSRYASSDGVFDPSTVLTIRLIDVGLISIGLVTWLCRNRLSRLWHTIMDRLDARPQLTFIALGLVVPWIGLLLVADSERTERSWWLWPMQVVMMASAVTYLPKRLRASRSLQRVGCVLLIGLIASNKVLLGHVTDWLHHGWSGTLAAEVRAADYVATSVQQGGKRSATIGYELYGRTFPALFNIVDHRYKLGANFDTFLKYRYQIMNADHCAEGMSTHDSYRIVESRADDMATEPERYKLISSRSDRLVMVAEFDRYQVFKAE
jgi:hypothetical protein